MATVAYLDTHVVVWLYADRLDLFLSAVRNCLERDQLFISPIVGLELQYLFEMGRTSEPAQPVLDTLARAVGLETCDLPFEDVVGAALTQNWTRDPFDRLIVAQATLRKSLLITKDKTIRKHYRQAFWRR
jgi:PIN domain nuclease of toxin-antitoxin system